ncbi:hypothetical protein C1645_842189, partial [Glomus cerebriforme]
MNNNHGIELSENSYAPWNCLENLPLPYLEILRVSKIPVRFLVSLIEGGNILELENLLIKCQYLDGLYIFIHER